MLTGRIDRHLDDGEDIDEVCADLRRRFDAERDELLRAQVLETLCHAALQAPQVRALVVQQGHDRDHMVVAAMADENGNHIPCLTARDLATGPAARGRFADAGGLHRWVRAGLIDPDDASPGETGRQYVVDLDTARTAGW